MLLRSKNLISSQTDVVNTEIQWMAFEFKDSSVKDKTTFGRFH